MTPEETSWWNWDHAAAAFPLLIDGFKITLLATVLGTLIALVLGLIVAIIRRSAPVIINAPVTWVVEFIRMTPLVVQLVFANLVLSPYIDSTLAIGIWVLGIHYTTYMAEVYRAGIDSVPTGQWEAATALNLSRAQTLRRIVLPQAFVAMIPPWGNLLIELLKATSLVSLITLSDLAFKAQQLNQNTLRTVEIFGSVLLVYLAMSLLITAGMRSLERRASRGLRRGKVA